MPRSTATRHRQPGSLRLVTKKARGKEYQRWQWRTHRQTDTGWTTVDVELGEHLVGMRTLTLIALGELSAPLLTERWVGWYCSSWDFLPAFTGRPNGTEQEAAWWVELPRQADLPVKLRFRSLRQGIDFRRARKSIAALESRATEVWRNLSRDPIVELGRLQWLEAEAQKGIDNIEEELQTLRKKRRSGDLNQRDFEADERDCYFRLEGWETIQSTVRSRWDELLQEMLTALPRTRRDELKPRIVMLAERLQRDSKQLRKWHDDHWDENNTLHW
ncbi:MULTISPECIES: hypothetical protein [unclassified Synechococcus]|uniref:hypothetical protein n=1 Tax=unclassified Synechococcus TaxID=2626047 RepID=UPI0039AEDBCC